MNVKCLINRAIRSYSGREALVYKDVRLTFGEIGRRANSVANGLLHLGARKGDRLGMLLPNCNQFIEIDFGLAKTGIGRVPLNSRLTASDHCYMLNDSNASILIFDQQYRKLVEEIRDQIKSVKNFIELSGSPEQPRGLDILSYDALLESGSADEPETTIDEKDLHTLFYTSGTTGVPKGVMLTQKSWASVAINLNLDYGPFTEDDVILNLQPLSHGAGFFVLPVFAKGGKNILIPEFKPSLVFETVEREKVTILKLIPTMLGVLIASPEKTNYNLSSLNSIIYGGSPIAQQVLAEAIQFFGPKLVQLYGQAEAPMCITTLSKRDHAIAVTGSGAERLKSAGKPCMNVEVQILDNNFNEVAPGVIGEIVVRGDHIMKGYWNKAKETAETLINGWVHTGDLGYADSEGFIFLVDRKKDMIISGGFNIYPKEIEDVILTHPAVQDVAVIGVPDQKWGEAVKAVIVLKPGQSVSEEGIIEHCRHRMASFKKPKSVDFVEELIRNPYGKVMKRELRDKYWTGQERKIH